MRMLMVCLLVLGWFDVGATRAQTVDSSAAPVDTTVSAPATPPTTTTAVTTPPPAAAPPSRPLSERVYYGGSVILSFGDVKRIGIYPMIAYKFSPKLSLGVEAGYEWLKFDNFDETANNYGGSVFGNYRVLPQLYAHAEYQMINYEIFTSPTTSDREWVPFLLVGGGFSKLMGRNTWAYVEVLFDVLNDDNSPYADGEPIISVGVGVGF
jgi:hypothetical protein